MKNTAKIAKDIRKKLGLTQYELAKKLLPHIRKSNPKITQMQIRWNIAKYETGIVRLPLDIYLIMSKWI